MRALGLLTLAATTSIAHASPNGRPQPVMIRIDQARAPGPAAAASSRLVYLHRCPSAGCIVTQGTDDSRTNTSSIAMGMRTIGPFTQPQATWDLMVACVEATFAPFDITVTDVDPGNVPHYENIIGGRSSDLRNDIPNAGGVAPFDCDEIPNAISYTFDVYGPDPEQLCWTAAQEVAHAFGLEHEMDPKDPLTYLAGPLPKRFQATDVPCGEFAPRTCQCTGNGTQNSYKHILAMFGPGAATPPTVSIRSPSSGKRVQPGFLTKVDAMDDVAVERVELWIDNVRITEDTMAPYVLAATDTLELGPHTVEVRAYDVQGVLGAASVDVELGPPCTASSGCTGDDVCVMGLCVVGPDRPGGLGYFCTADTECLSGQCRGTGGPEKYCVESCDASIEGSCPAGFDCLDGANVCWRSDDGGCCSTGGSPLGAGLLGFGVVVILLRRRRLR
jgi:hypothetical protein